MVRQASRPLSQRPVLPLAEHMPWPNWVILRAVQVNSGRAAMIPARTLVLPTLREFPPITTTLTLCSVLIERPQTREIASLATCDDSQLAWITYTSGATSFGCVINHLFNRNLLIYDFARGHGTNANLCLAFRIQKMPRP